MTVKGILSKLFKSSKKECENSKQLERIVPGKSNERLSNAQRAVKCVNPDTGAVYPSLSDAAKAEGISRSSARRLVNGKYESIKGVKLNRL